MARSALIYHKSQSKNRQLDRADLTPRYPGVRVVRSSHVKFKLMHHPGRCQVDSMLHCGLNQNPWRFVRDSRDIAAGARRVAASREARSCPTKTGRCLRTC